MSGKFGAAAVATVLLCVWTAFSVPQVAEEQDLSKDLIRFHVIANSDSIQDQQLKRNVRDAILDKVGSRFEKTDSVEEARRTVLASLDEIQAVAREEVIRNGEDYPVAAQLGHFDFPAKAYGSFTLPAGNYEAVKVIIGEGKGANWWCVLFPPLCFVDISNSVSVEPEAAKVSKEVQEEGVYQDKKNIKGTKENTTLENAPEADPETEPVIQFKLKLFEVFDRSKSFLAGWPPKENNRL